MEAGAATGVGVLLRRNAGERKRMLRNRQFCGNGFVQFTGNIAYYFEFTGALYADNDVESLETNRCNGVGCGV